MDETYPKKSEINAKVEIRDSPIQGKGIFAKETIKKGEVVVIWGGTYVKKTAAEKAKADGKLIMQLDENLYSVEERREDSTYCMNHSCNPNVWMKNAFTLTARRDIQQDEELVADYALWEADENFIMPWNCKCNSYLCRQKITGKDWLLFELQIRYQNHFSPLLNKRIAQFSKDKVH